MSCLVFHKTDVVKHDKSCVKDALEHDSLEQESVKQESLEGDMGQDEGFARQTLRP